MATQTPRSNPSLLLKVPLDTSRSQVNVSQGNGSGGFRHLGPIVREPDTTTRCDITTGISFRIFANSRPACVLRSLQSIPPSCVRLLLYDYFTDTGLSFPVFLSHPNSPLSSLLASSLLSVLLWSLNDTVFWIRGQNYLLLLRILVCIHLSTAFSSSFLTYDEDDGG